MSFYIFIFFVLALGFQRLLEVWVSRHHEKALLALGGQEHAPGHFAIMKLIHICWLLAMIAEVYIFNRSFSWYYFIPAFILTCAGQILRYLAITTLKERWTVRIMTIPNAAPVTHGIFRYVKHPNYLGVMLEFIAVPMLHSAYLTALFFSIANYLLLLVRISAEEKALSQENNYTNYFSLR